MPDTFRLEVTTPERMVVREDAEEAQIPALNGYLGILPGHAPLLAQLAAGELSYKRGGHTHYLAISGGFMEVQPVHARVLVETAERAEEIDVARAQRSRQRAEERLGQPAADMDVERTQAALCRALARLQVASRR